MGKIPLFYTKNGFVKFEDLYKRIDEDQFWDKIEPVKCKDKECKHCNEVPKNL